MTEKQIKLAIAHCEKTISKFVSLLEGTGTQEEMKVVARVKGKEEAFHVWVLKGRVFASQS